MPIKTRSIANLKNPSAAKGDPAPTNLVLPFPPSANRYWRMFRGHMVISAEAKAYKAAVRNNAQFRGSRPVAGKVHISLAYYRPRQSGDLDNRIKIMLDSLEGILFVNDSQVVDIRALQRHDKKNPRVEIVWGEFE